MINANGSNLWVSLDTEGTSTSTNYNRIISIGAVIFEETEKHIVPKEVREHFFASVLPIPTGAVMCHGLTREILQEKSKGKFFQDSKEDIEDLLYSGYNLLGHNVITYDLQTITANVTNAGWSVPKFGKIEDTLALSRDQLKEAKRAGYLKNNKLETLFDYALAEQGMKKESCESVFRMICKQSGSVAEAHSAAWDAFMTLTVYKFLKGK